MSVVIEAANATGNYIAGVLSFIPEDLIVLGGIVFVAWIWWQNLRAWLRIKRERRMGRASDSKEE